MGTVLSMSYFQHDSVGKESACNTGETQETWVQTLGWEDPLEEEMATIPVFLPEKSQGQRSLASYNSKGCKESDMTEQLSMHAH